MLLTSMVGAFQNRKLRSKEPCLQTTLTGEVPGQSQHATRKKQATMEAGAQREDSKYSLPPRLDAVPEFTTRAVDDIFLHSGTLQSCDQRLPT